ncbi:MAG: hypothetical protein MRERV_3c025 [Mycoplasmataceae bacterium RV_VA103A]|nr:MAG: hypothetical protein MRERV_3c025 [Mycoplasmataceae bacterium RV_VA103A]
MLKNNTNSEKEEFEKYLQKIEDPDYNGQDVSWHLPENASPIERAKYEICEKILGYQQDNNLSDEEVASKIKLTVGETRDILYCHINYFTLDRLVVYASKLFAPSQVKVIVEPKKPEKHARVI